MRAFVVILLILFAIVTNKTSNIKADPSLLACANCLQIMPQTATQWNRLTEATWAGYKNRYIYCGADCANNVGLVFDPSIGFQATSEGVGYGLLMAVMMNDQANFNIIYEAAQAILFDPSSGLFNWRANNDLNINGFGSATDADQDIAAALVFAQSRVDAGDWQQHTTLPYDKQAESLIDAIWSSEIVDGRYILPGNRFGGGGQAITNPSYFSPAWYRIFDQFQSTQRWQPVIDQGYRTLFQSPGSSLGLAPDWSDARGQSSSAYCQRTGIEAAKCRYDMFYDAIRVPWRIGLDCLWFGDERACEWSRRSANFLRGLPDDQFAIMYTLDGTPIVNYRDETMIAMWLVAAVAASDPSLQERIESQLATLGENAITNGYWGNSPESYYNQSLAWFASALLSGDFVNLFALETQSE